MTPHAVQFEVVEPPRWARIQILLRLAVLALLAVLNTRMAWICGAFYWGLPVIAAISIQRDGARAYPEKNGRSVLRVLHWWNAFVAYMLLVSDRFPASSTELAQVRFDVRPSGAVDFTHALLRIVTSLPEFLAVLLLGWLASFVAVIGAVCVLFSERVPTVLLRFLGYYTALQARWLAYHAALVDTHPLLETPSWQTR